MQLLPADIPEFKNWRENKMLYYKGWQMPDSTNKYLDILKPIAELILNKNTDYGDSYSRLRDKYGKTAFLIRLADKMNRLESLADKDPLVEDESEERTIEDVIGYCTLELVYRREKKRENN